MNFPQKSHFSGWTGSPAPMMQVSQKRDCWFCEGDMLFFQHFHTFSYFLIFFVRFEHFFRFCEGDLELNLSKTFILSNFWAIWVISNVAVLLPDPLRSRKFCRGSEAISDRISPFLKGGVWKLPSLRSNQLTPCLEQELPQCTIQNTVESHG